MPTNHDIDIFLCQNGHMNQHSEISSNLVNWRCPICNAKIKIGDTELEVGYINNSEAPLHLLDFKLIELTPEKPGIHATYKFKFCRPYISDGNFIFKE